MIRGIHLVRHGRRLRKVRVVAVLFGIVVWLSIGVVGHHGRRRCLSEFFRLNLTRLSVGGIIVQLRRLCDVGRFLLAVIL